MTRYPHPRIVETTAPSLAFAGPDAQRQPSRPRRWARGTVFLATMLSSSSALAVPASADDTTTTVLNAKSAAAATTRLAARADAATTVGDAEPDTSPATIGSVVVRPITPSTKPAKVTTKKKTTKAAARSVTATTTTAAPAKAADATKAADALPVALVSAENASGVWLALRKCESGNRYAVNTGNGYYGAYQFSAQTWRSLGYPGLPHEAPPAMQDEAAQRLQAKAGWGQWPACARKLGLI